MQKVGFAASDFVPFQCVVDPNRFSGRNLSHFWTEKPFTTASFQTDLETLPAARDSSADE